MLLEVIHRDHAMPIVGDIRQTEVVAQIDEIQYVLLKTGPPKPDRGFEEFRADAAVGADRTSHFIDIGTSFFTEGGDRIDR